jgi:hypothetical protein
MSGLDPGKSAPCRCALREGFRQAGGRRPGFGGQLAIRAGSSVLRNRRRRGGRNGGEAHHCRWLRSKPEESRRPADWSRCEATFTRMAGSVESL